VAQVGEAIRAARSVRACVGSGRCAFAELGGGGVEFVARDVRIAAHGGQVCVAEVLGDQARVGGRLAKPGGRGVPQRVRGDVLLEARPAACAPDDRGENALLQAAALQPAEDRLVGAGVSRARSAASSAASCGESGCCRGLPPFPQRTSSPACCGSSVTSRQSSAIRSERRSRGSRAGAARWRCCARRASRGATCRSTRGRVEQHNRHRQAGGNPDGDHQLAPVREQDRHRHDPCGEREQA
jgi:hypothetical protein